MQSTVAAEMAALVFEHMAVVVACAVVLNTLLGCCKLVQQVVAAFLKRLQMIAIRDSIRLQGGSQIISCISEYMAT